MKQIIIALAALTTVACAADTDLETAFCDGLAAGASHTVTASVAVDGAPNATSASRIDIELLPIGDEFGGFVSYAADEAGSFAFGLTEDVPFVVRDGSGNVVPIDQTVEGSTQCDELAVRHTLKLDKARYIIELGPTDANVIGIIAEESNDDL